MQNIKDIPIADLPATIKGLGLKQYAAGQIVQWLYRKGAASFEDMTNLSKDARKILSENFYVSHLMLAKELTSSDGTKKFAWELFDGSIIESVLIPSEPYSKVPANLKTCKLKNLKTSKRLTICISTQVGCAMGCIFCRTAGMGLVRNLTQSEIVDQILETQRIAASRITNVVLMGMGEPLANYENVIEAVRIMTDTKGMGLSRRHVTLSTSGLIPGIERLSKENLGIKLAISLNATTDGQREAIMPVNKKYPLAKLLAALKNYSNVTKRQRLTFEYVIIKDFNDSNEDAKRLVAFLSHFPSKVNLIPLNPPSPPFTKGGNKNYKTPSEETIQRFAQFLRNKHIQVNIRASRGQDILAACGQLASKAV